MLGSILNVGESGLPPDAYQPPACWHPDLPPVSAPASDDPRAQWRHLPVGTRWDCPECGAGLTVVSLQTGGRIGALELRWMGAIEA